MRETPHTAMQYSWITHQTHQGLNDIRSKNLLDKGTIRRKDLWPFGDWFYNQLLIEHENPQRLYVWKANLMELEPQWIVGFVDGEGCFHVGINAHKEMSTGYQILPEFTVVQHQRDVQVLHALKAYFGCGVVRRNHAERMAYRVRSLSHLTEIIAPFFLKHQLKTRKNVEFRKFRSVLLIMNEGKHLTTDGLEEIRDIQRQMNRVTDDADCRDPE